MKVTHIDGKPVGGINVGELKRLLPELLALADRKADAAETFAAGVDAAAYRCGASKKALRKLVAAMAKDKTADAGAEAAELSDLIDAVSPASSRDAA